MWKTKKSEIVFKNQWIVVHNDQIEFDNGKPGVYSYIDRHHGTEAVVVTPEKKIILLKQFRYPSREYDWSIPGGKIDTGESAEQAVKREVEEEVGVKIDHLEQVGIWSAQSSASTEKITIFVAWSASKPHEAGLQDESVKQIKEVSAIEALAMIDSNEIKDPITISALQLVIRRYL